MMMKIIKIWLPFPPSVNNLFPTNRRTGQRYPSRAYTAWKKQAWAYIKTGRSGQAHGRVDLNIERTAKDRRPRDADNYLKPLIDALVQNGVLIDDNSRHVRQVTAQWLEPNKTTAGATITITQAH